MAKSIIIVESPTKVKTISKYVGRQYKVLATVGHIKDLPKGKIGVDIEADFKPDYVVIPGKKKVINELVKNSENADEVLIATDPDREGEAIAWHISREIGKKNENIHRVLFNEITKKGIAEGLKNPGPINEDLVQAQQARRVLDRIVGYQVSPFLWKIMSRGLSAGRVQSVALRLICEREDAIEAFTAHEYWTIEAQFSKGESTRFTAKLAQFQGKKIDLPDEKVTAGHIEVIKKQKYKIADIRTKEVARTPHPPFITSTLQQEASRRFEMTTSRVMLIAQQLYEGIDLGPEETVGLITYMRTDSTRISNEAADAARNYITNAFGNEYLPPVPREFKNQKRIQDAHEAIRPTDVQRTPESLSKYLTKDQYKIYELIWKRLIASQMSDARLLQTQVDITGGDYLFRVTGSILEFPGFLRVLEDITDNGQEDDKEEKIPGNLSVNDSLIITDIIPEQHFTKPPARYSESTLVKELDALGIGRPSTYASIIKNILSRNYVERKEKRLVPTDLGREVSKILVSNFPDIFNVQFTSTMEEELDKIESGTKQSLTVLEEFYDPFRRSLEEVQSRKDEIKQTLQEKTDLICELCGNPMVLRYGRFGRFYACTGFPKCKNTKPYNNEGKKEAEPELLEEKCPNCSAPLVIKTSRAGGKFIGCSAYPQCNYIRPISTGIQCPRENCGGEVVQRRSKKGRIFYGCSKYPQCDFVSWNPIAYSPCEKCGNPYMEIKNNKKQGELFYCPKCKNSIEKVEKANVTDS